MPASSYELTRCIVCGSAESRLIADGDEIARQMEALWAFHDRRMRPGTPTSRLRDRVAFSEHPPLRVVECADCGLVYRNPTERARDVRAIYEDESVDAATLRQLHHRQLPTQRAMARRLARELPRAAAVLEVGSYVGAFLAAAREIGLRVVGLDVNTVTNRLVRDLGFEVHDGELATFEPPHPLDAIAIWNTFDQLADPRAALLRAGTLLRPGGVLAIRVPSGAYYAERLRRGRGHARLALNNLLGFPYRFGFTPASLARLLDATGFETTGARGDVLVPVADRWTRRWARVEERVVKAVWARACARRPHRAPWFELYARRRREPI